MKEENLQEKKEKAHELILFQAHEVFKNFVEKLTATRVIDVQVEIEKEKGERERERKREREIERRSDRKKTNQKRQKGITPLGKIEIFNYRPK